MAKDVQILLLLCLLHVSGIAQNVGINNTNPRFPLTFSTTTGDKLVLWDDGNVAGNNYGIGLQSGVMQLHTHTVNDDVVFGYGRSTAMVETMRIKGNGRVGIGTNIPVVRLDVAGTNSWDLVNGEGDMRIGNSAYRLKFGIALDGGGIGAANIMQTGGIGNLGIGAGNKYLLQLNGPGGYVDFSNNSGGLRINGNAGAAGQVLTSNGAAAPSWNTLILPNAFNNTVLLTSTTEIVNGTSVGAVDMPGLSYTFTATGTTKVLVQANIPASAIACSFCGSSLSGFDMILDGGLAARFLTDLYNGYDMVLNGTQIFTVAAGVHTIKITVDGVGPDVRFGRSNPVFPTNMIVQLIPQ